jgi:hypothetical protein
MIWTVACLRSASDKESRCCTLLRTASIQKHQRDMRQDLAQRTLLVMMTRCVRRSPAEVVGEGEQVLCSSLGESRDDVEAVRWESIS